MTVLLRSVKEKTFGAKFGLVNEQVTLSVSQIPKEFTDEEAEFLLNLFGGEIQKISGQPVKVPVADKASDEEVSRFADAEKARVEKGAADALAIRSESAGPVRPIDTDFKPDVDRPAEDKPAPPPGMYYCTECKRLHSNLSKIGKSHLKYRGEPEPKIK